MFVSHDKSDKIASRWFNETTFNRIDFGATFWSELPSSKRYYPSHWVKHVNATAHPFRSKIRKGRRATSLAAPGRSPRHPFAVAWGVPRLRSPSDGLELVPLRSGAMSKDIPNQYLRGCPIYNIHLYLMLEGDAPLYNKCFRKRSIEIFLETKPWSGVWRVFLEGYSNGCSPTARPYPQGKTFLHCENSCQGSRGWDARGSCGLLTESKGILCEKSSANRTLRPNHVEKIRWPKGSVECHYGPSPLWRGPIKVFDHGPAFVPAQERTHCAFMFQFNLLFWYW